MRLLGPYQNRFAVIWFITTYVRHIYCCNKCGNIGPGHDMCKIDLNKVLFFSAIASSTILVWFAYRTYYARQINLHISEVRYLPGSLE